MKTAPDTRFTIPTFSEMPRSYAALCALLLPRPIRSRRQAAEVEAMIDALAVDERRLSKDQHDYLEMLCDVLEVWDEACAKPARQPSPAAFLALLLEQSGQSAAEVALQIGVDRSAMTRLLSRERSFTVPQARALAEHFAVHAGAFLGLPQP